MTLVAFKIYTFRVLGWAVLVWIPIRMVQVGARGVR